MVIGEACIIVEDMFWTYQTGRDDAECNRYEGR